LPFCSHQLKKNTLHLSLNQAKDEEQKIRSRGTTFIHQRSIAPTSPGKVQTSQSVFPLAQITGASGRVLLSPGQGDFFSQLLVLFHDL
jgi:hypothetical protein